MEHLEKDSIPLQPAAPARWKNDVVGRQQQKELLVGNLLFSDLGLQSTFLLFVFFLNLFGDKDNERFNN